MRLFHRIYIDANILIDLFEDRGAIGSALQTIVNQHPVDRQHPLFLTSQLTFSETLVRPYRDKDVVLARTYLETRFGNYWLQVEDVSFAVLECASALRAAMKSLRLPDAIHIATAQLSGCSHLLTNDLGLSSIADLRHPLSGEVVPALDVIRADVVTLELVLKELT